MAEASSPLSLLSSDESFYTANASNLDGETTIETTASSPTELQPSIFRKARQLPPELRDHCQIYLEEQLYFSAISVLNSTLSAGTSKKYGSSKPARIPPPSHLALLSTLTIHPAFTTRADAPDRVDASSRALGYLRNLIAIVGPVNANLATAFQFRKTPKWTRRGGGYAGVAEGSEEADGVDGNRLRGQLANGASIWERSQDFWSVVGWAFNCSTLYAQRWKYWKLWLGFMLDVLESDWEERSRIDAEAVERTAVLSESTLQDESLMVKYVGQLDGRSDGLRWITKALFANGDKKSCSEFQSVFDKETKSAKYMQRKRKRTRELDLEQDKFGDYLDESFSSGGSEPPTPEKRAVQRPAKQRQVSTSAESEATNLRLRLFKLVSRVFYFRQDRQQVDQLYETFAGGIQHLPLPAFSNFINYNSSPLIIASQVALIQELFHRLLQSNACSPSSLGKDPGAMSSQMLARCYLPYAANTTAADDNAKVSLLAENALLLLWNNDALKYSPELRDAALKGISLREAKVKPKKGVKGRYSAKAAIATDSLGVSILNGSAERIKVLCDVLETCCKSDDCLESV